MKKLLFITYSFPPLLAPRSIQTSRTANYLLDNGWQSTVLSVDSKHSLDVKDTGLLDLVSGSIEVIRARSIEPKILFTFLWHIMRPLLSMPDSKFVWRFFSKKMGASHLKAGCFDLIFSSANYLSNHLVALSLKRKSGLPWVAHFSDPWTDNPYNRYGAVDGFINKRMEKNVIDHADALVFATEETRRLVMKKYPPEWMDKACVVPNCYDTKLISRLRKRQNEKMIFTYTGNFYRGIRTPLALFKALKWLAQNEPKVSECIEIQIVGELDHLCRESIHELQIQKLVKVLGPVSYMDSLEYIVNADVLLLIDAPSEENIFLSSKLVEYVGSKNPILGLTPKKGTSAQIIRKTGGIIVEPDDIKGIAEGILDYYNMYTRSKLGKSFISHEDLKQYDAALAVKKLATLFDCMVAEKQACRQLVAGSP